MHPGPEPRYSVIIPGRNEAGTLGELTGRLAAVMAALPGGHELLLVDDASTDSTAATARALRAQYPALSVLTHARRRGRGAAVLTGLAAARGEIIITIDADLENRPEDIPTLVGRLDRGADCVTGRRTGRPATGWRNRFSAVYNRVLRRLTGPAVTDFNCGLKVFRAAALRDPAIRARLENNGDLLRFIVPLLHRRGRKVAEVPVAWEPRRHGRSQYGPGRYLAGLAQFVIMLFAWLALTPGPVDPPPRAPRRLLPFLLLAALALLYTLPVFATWQNWPVSDEWGFLTAPRVAAYISVRQFHQLPLWTPYLHGGYYEWAHPHAASLSPAFVLDLLAGPVAAYKLKIPLYLFLAMTGAYLLARRCGATVIPALTAAVIYGLAGQYTDALARAGQMYLAHAWVPFVFFGLLGVPDRGSNAATAIGAAAWAATYCEGSPYHFAFTSLTLASVVPFCLFRTGRHTRIRLRTGVIIMLVAGLGLVSLKLIPTLSFLAHHNRPAPPAANLYSLPALGSQLLFQRSTATYMNRPPGGGDPAESFLYLGILPVLLAIPAVFLIPRAARAPVAAVTAVTLAVFLGSQDTVLGLPWRLLAAFPPFSGMYNTWRSVFLLYLLCGTGTALTMTRLARGRAGTLLGAAMLVVITADLFTVSQPMWRLGFARAPLQDNQPHALSGNLTQYAGENSSDGMIGLVWFGQGNITVFDALTIPALVRTANDPAYRGEYEISDPRNRVLELAITPQRITGAVEFAVPGDLVINQNYSPDWVASPGHTVARDGRLAVSLPAGRHRFLIAFQPLSFYAGLAAALLGIAILLAGLTRVPAKS